MWTAIGAGITLILGPLLAFFLKRYWDGHQADRDADNRHKSEEQKNRDMGKSVSDQTRDVNESIDKQKDSMKSWESNTTEKV